jgi:hypothetical protein
MHFFMWRRLLALGKTHCVGHWTAYLGFVHLESPVGERVLLQPLIDRANGADDWVEVGNIPRMESNCECRKRCYKVFKR